MVSSVSLSLQGKTPSRADMVRRVLNQPPASMRFDRPRDVLPPEFNNAFGQTMLKVLGYYSKKSQLMHGEVGTLCSLAWAACGG